MLDNVLHEANQELINIARKDMPSPLRNRAYGGLSDSNWMTEVLNELSKRCPTVARILATLLDCSLLDAGKKSPAACLIYGMIMFMRCHDLSRIQRINTILLTEGKATKNVCSFKFKFLIFISMFALSVRLVYNL